MSIRRTLIIAIVFQAMAGHGQFFSGILDDPNTGTNGATYATGMSEGVICGYYQPTNGLTRGFLWSNGVYQDFNVPNADQTFILGMSGSNIVGYYSVSNVLEWFGFFYNGSTFTTLNFPGSANVNSYYGGTFATGMSADTIVGYVTDYLDDSSGFLTNSSGHTVLNDPAAYSGPYSEGLGTLAEGISGSNVVGYYYDGQDEAHGFFLNGTNYTTLDDPAGTGTHAMGVDGSNVVGYYYQGGVAYGFYYSNGIYTSIFGGANTRDVYPQSISGNTVVGYYVDSFTGTHGFTATLSPDSQFLIATNNGGIDITGYIGSNATVVVPSLINGLPVTQIGPNAFQYSLVTNVELPPSLLGIGDEAFDDTFIIGITIPASVTNIGIDPFFGCPEFTAITVAAGNSSYSSAGGVLFNADQTTLVDYPEGQPDASYTVPAGVTTIGNRAFYGAAYLEGLTLPSSLRDIEDYAFTFATRLFIFDGPYAEDLGYIPEGVTNIGAEAFNVTSLGTLTIPSSVTTLGVGAFSESKLANICFEGNPPTNNVSDLTMFSGDAVSAVYYVVEATGWGATFDGVATAPCQQCGQGTATGEGEQVILVANGYGEITHAAWPKNMVTGKKYSVMATPKAKNIFVNWVGGTSQPYMVLSVTPSYTFTFESNLVLEANFETNVFMEAQGAYYGLLAPSGEPRQQTNSGGFKINVTTAGLLSGDLYLGSATPIVLNGKFAPDGTATVVNKRKGENTLTIILSLDITNEIVSGTVSDGSFVAQLSGFQSVFSAKNRAPFAGTYTLVIPGTNDAAVGPYGTSYGTVTVNPAGAVTLAGGLADGEVLSESSVVSQDGHWPFYISLYGGRGSLWGWNLFTNQTIVSAPTLSWINQTNSSKTAVYRSGFTNQEVMLTGEQYVPASGLPGNFAVTLEGANLPFVITNSVTITSSDKVVTNSDDTNKLKMTINKTTGAITGTFANPSNPKQTIKVGGVILQGQTNAQGYFLGTNLSGTFLLESP